MTPTGNALPDLLAAVQALSRADKIRLIQVLATDLASEEGVPGIEAGTAYPIWTPHDALDAADALLRELQKSDCGSPC